MKCSVIQQSRHSNGNINMKTLNNKNPYNKESNIDNVVDELCMKLQDIKNQEANAGRMHKYRPEQSDAARKYYAAFPALKKADHTPSQYYLPPPAWCRKDIHSSNKESMHADLIQPNDWNKKKFISGKERRNSYHGQRKYNKKRCNNYSRSFESKEELPEWVTYEGVWDMETQDPVREFIRAIALDEGYGTCENTVTDELREINQLNMKMKEVMVPDWEVSFDLNKEWIIREDLEPAVRTPMEEEMYAKFEAKFNSSIEALWTKDQNTPDDEYQDLPIDVHDLLSSPSDQQFYEPPEKTFPSLTESIWSNDATDSTLLGFNTKRAKTPNQSVDNLHDKFEPLNLEDNTIFKQLNPSCFRPDEPLSFYNFDRIYDAIPTVTEMMRSLTTLNHSKSLSSFAEVVPRKRSDKEPFERTVGYENRLIRPKLRFHGDAREDLLTSSRTHFRPIREDADTARPNHLVRYLDGACFDIRGDLDPVDYRRSESGYMVVETDGQTTRYLEYRNREGLEYGRLKLPTKRHPQRETDLELVGADEFRLKFAIKHLEKAVQTEETMRIIDGCEECGRTTGAKKMRASVEGRVRCETMRCERCDVRGVEPAPEVIAVSTVSVASREVSACDRKRRHSAALRCPRANGPCGHPHAPFLHCCALDRPLTR